MSQAPNAESRQAPPDVAQSLFWDDVRTGLKLACVGMILLVVGELGAQFRAHDFLVGALLIVGAALTLIGLGICTAIPKETGVRPLAIAAALFTGLGILALVIGLFYPDAQMASAIAVLLGGVALVLFALVLRGCTAYIGHRPLMAAARSFVTMAAGYALFLLAAVVVTLGVEVPTLRVLVDLVAIGIVGMVVYIAWGTSDAILRARLGQPLELPRFVLSAEYLAAEEQRLARENVTFPPPPPPHFSETEVRFFHADDAKAAGAIVVLMAGIFSVGVVLYLIVAWSVAS